MASYPVAEAEAVSRERMVSIIVAGVLACAVLIAMMSILLQRLVLTPLGGEPSRAAEAAAHRRRSGGRGGDAPGRYAKA
ncbi:MAG: hypothetical protein IPL58_13425 [Betaproteobacteria bacterium]|uniref:Uncharacterized protein n=1 Tax=Candidatus Proximibacter danicus TaxID=2954365 RepID=A0A9D7PS79_9PROT|nr:hypothetical protein [Candidatus Proximibacter danicus]